MITKTLVLVNAQHIAVTKDILKKLNALDLVNRLAAFGSPVPAPLYMQAMLRPQTTAYRNAQIAARLSKSTQVTSQGLDTGFKVIDSAPRISGSISETGTRLLSATSGRSLANLLLARENLEYSSCFPHPGFQKFQEISLEPLESRYLDIDLGIPYGAKPGEYITFHFEQRAGDIAMGGYCVIVKVTEQNLQQNAFTHKARSK